MQVTTAAPLRPPDGEEANGLVGEGDGKGEGVGEGGKDRGGGGGGGIGGDGEAAGAAVVGRKGSSLLPEAVVRGLAYGMVNGILLPPVLVSSPAGGGGVEEACLPCACGHHQPRGLSSLWGVFILSYRVMLVGLLNGVRWRRSFGMHVYIPKRRASGAGGEYRGRRLAPPNMMVFRAVLFCGCGHVVLCRTALPSTGS